MRDGHKSRIIWEIYAECDESAVSPLFIFLPRRERARSLSHIETRRFRAEVFLLPLVSLLPFASPRLASQRREDAGRFVTVARAPARAGEPKLT